MRRNAARARSARRRSHSRAPLLRSFVCQGMPEDGCLGALGDEVQQMSDKDRLVFEKMVLSSAFQQASHVRQEFADAESVTCNGLSDKLCLSELDSQLNQMTDKTKLALLVSSCNMMQHWSSFRQEEAQKQQERLQSAQQAVIQKVTSHSLTLTSVAAVLAVVGVVVRAVSRRARGAYTSIDSKVPPV